MLKKAKLYNCNQLKTMLGKSTKKRNIQNDLEAMAFLNYIPSGPVLSNSSPQGPGSVILINYKKKSETEDLWDYLVDRVMTISVSRKR